MLFALILAESDGLSACRYAGSSRPTGNRFPQLLRLGQRKVIDESRAARGTT
jgi:hypothetical protein